MALTPGTRLGPYEVTAQIGVGGMGEVYKATDTNLKRAVAIKVLPSAVAGDADRLARFQREAEVLAALNHPNIAAIYGLERSGVTTALIMELVEGPTLADRIAQGAIPVDESLSIAKQIAEALEAAHEQGIIHRDLKPANIKVRADGAVKVLDFGLAKAMEPAGAMSPNASISPTITSPAMMTGVGMILGTAAYMSPEQAKGKVVDKRVDIWAFGAVLFEMLTGQRAFAGDAISDVLASVLAREAQFSAIPEAVPGPVRQVVKACLQKDLKQRVHDMADVRLAMAGVFETVRAVEAPVAVKAVASRWKGVAAAAAVVLAAGFAIGATWILKPTDPRPLMRFSHRLGEESFTRGLRPVVAISRNGGRLAYVANDRIYLRNLDDPDASPIPGTNENPSSPFFSPDGEWVGFFSNNELKKVPIAGGTPVALTKAANPLGVSWGLDDTIVYGQNDGIWRVSANGDSPVQIVKAADGERVHAPQMLPGGDDVLFAVTKATGATKWDEADIVVQTLDTGERKVLRSAGADPRYVPTGHLVYALGNTLFAVLFDLGAREVRGGPVPVIPEVQRSRAIDVGIAQYALSDDGTVVYVRSDAEFDLALVDRSGKPRTLPTSSRHLSRPRFSPDDTRIAATRGDGGVVTDIWIYEIPESQWRQLTFDGGNFPVWTPDGRAITFWRDGALWQVPADFSGAALPLPGTEVPGNAGPIAWSPNGDVLLYSSAAGVRAFSPKNVSRRSVTTDTVVLPTSERTDTASTGSFSPDGRWVAYMARAGTGEAAHVYVSPFPFGAGGHRKVTNDPASHPVWSRDGRELFVFDGDSLRVLRMSTEPTLIWTNPTAVFSTSAFVPFNFAGTNYDVTRDGQQFVAVVRGGAEAGGERSTQEIQIVVNWHEELKRLVPTK